MLIFLLLVGAAVLAYFAARAQQAANLRLLGGVNAPDDKHCWLCGHEELSNVANNTFRCKACGNVQGEQASALQETARRAALAGLDPSQRRQQAALLLQQTKLELLAVQGELGHILELSVADLRRHEGPEDNDVYVGNDKVSRFGAALTAVSALQRTLVDAAVFLVAPGHQEHAAHNLEDLDTLLGAAELGVIAAGGGFSREADERAHDVITRAMQHLAKLQVLHQRLTHDLSRPQSTERA